MILENPRKTTFYNGIKIPSCGEAAGLKALLKDNDWMGCYNTRPDLRKFKSKLIRTSRTHQHTMLKLPSSIPTKKHLRFRDARYADDWILITNAPLQIV